MSLTPGTRLGPYEILAPIGAGGMGEVWKARDTRLNRIVAIKRLNGQHSSRFEQEARAIAALNHPNICQIYDIGPDYIVMEYVEGSPLQGPLPQEEAAKLAIQIVNALEEAHAKRILHRDLKPGNILVTKKGAVKLLDFGLAKIATDEDATLSMAISGTPLYMSPEQAEGQTVDARSDVFSFGAVLYEMLSGRRAFSTLGAVLRDEPDPIRSPLGEIAAKCLKKSAAHRYQTMADVRAALEKPRLQPTGQMPSIAVLPFANMSADKENEYFSDGLAEEILNLLAKIPGLKVIARTSSFSFRGKDQDVRKIAEALGVGHILEGSVRRAGNRLRVTAQLIHATDGSHLWSERYDRDMTDVFAIQDEIAAAISHALEVRLAPRAQVVNAEAYQWYLKGQYHRLRLTPEGFTKAKQCYEHALAIDPNYVAAHVGLAAYHYGLGTLLLKPWREAAPLAKAAAQRAVAIDPTNSEAHSILGVVAGLFDYDWKLAESHFRKTMAREPVPPFTRYRYAHFYLIWLGRIDEAIAQYRLALETDPVAMFLHWSVAYGTWHTGRFREAMDEARATLEIDPSFYFAWLTLGTAQMSAGLVQEAVESLERGVELAPWFGIGLSWLAGAYHLAGDQERARDCLSKIEDVFRYSYFAITGEVDAMFDSLEKSYRRGDLLYPSWPFFDPYRSHPRFQALLAKMNLV